MCNCQSGYTLAEDGLECIDDNKCSLKNRHGPCQDVCANTKGGYKCSYGKILISNFFLGTFMCNCQSGYTLAEDGLECIDDNECSLNNGHGPCQDVCTNTEGGYKCSCRSGTTLANDGHTCQSSDGCDLNNGGCSHQCIDSYSQVFCLCPQGREYSYLAMFCPGLLLCPIY